MFACCQKDYYSIKHDKLLIYDEGYYFYINIINDIKHANRCID